MKDEPRSENYRWQRIERLLEELKYECSLGMIQGEIDETIEFRFYVPTSKSIPGGVVGCQFVTRPVHQAFVPLMDLPRLRVVK